MWERWITNRRCLRSIASSRTLTTVRATGGFHMHGGLSWIPVSFLLHVKYTIVSYRIVSYRMGRLGLGVRASVSFQIFSISRSNLSESVSGVLSCGFY